MRSVIATAAAAAFIGLSTLSAHADQTAPPSITVSGTGSVQYSPDIAQISFGVRGESSTAAAAAKSVNARAHAVVAAMRRLGIADANITTSNYSIEYQPPQQPDGPPMPQPAPGQVQSMSSMHKPVLQGKYVATETIDVKTAIDNAGSVLDAAVAAGANETYGLSFDTSQRQALYRQALAKAVADAAAQADILAKAAGVEIAGIQSLSVGGGGPQPMYRTVSMAASAPGPPVMGGTGTIDVSVDVVYRIK